MDASLYHTIDENKMVDLVTLNDPYLEVVCGSSSSDNLTSGSDSVKSNSSSTSGYLHPYHSLIATDNEHPYEQSQLVYEAHNQTITDITDDQYQDCLTPLENMTETINYPNSNITQVIEVTVHREERSDSISVKNDIKTLYNIKEKINSENYKEDSKPTESENI